jgi:hypothetical protein
MSFLPSDLVGFYGQEREVYATQQWPLGKRLVLPDGKTFRFAKMGAVAGVVGKVYQGPPRVSNHLNCAVAAAAIGDRTVTVTLGATAATLNQYAGGYLVTRDGTGEGRYHRILSNPAADASATCVITLHPDYPIKVALVAGGTSEVSLIPDPYLNVIVAPTTLTNVAVGVTVSAPTVASGATPYCWLQESGIASVLVNGTWVLGETLVSSTAVAGALMPAAAATSGEIARAIDIAADTEYGLAKLTIG